METLLPSTQTSQQCMTSIAARVGVGRTQARCAKIFRYLYMSKRPSKLPSSYPLLEKLTKLLSVCYTIILLSWKLLGYLATKVQPTEIYHRCPCTLDNCADPSMHPTHQAFSSAYPSCPADAPPESYVLIFGPALLLLRSHL